MAIDINNLGSGNNTRTESRGKARTESGVAAGTRTDTQGGDSVSRDSVQLTDTATKLRQLERNLADLPVADEGRVAQVKKAIADGSYHIDTLSIANKMLNFERSLG